MPIVKETADNCRNSIQQNTVFWEICKITLYNILFLACKDYTWRNANSLTLREYGWKKNITSANLEEILLKEDFF